MRKYFKNCAKIKIIIQIQKIIRMGLPIDQLVIATNENDILVRALATGFYAIRPVRPTQSPAMDITVSSNFERLLFEASQRNPKVVQKAMNDLNTRGEFQIPAETLHEIRTMFNYGSATEVLYSLLWPSLQRFFSDFPPFFVYLGIQTFY